MSILCPRGKQKPSCCGVRPVRNRLGALLSLGLPLLIVVSNLVQGANAEGSQAGKTVDEPDRACQSATGNRADHQGRSSVDLPAELKSKLGSVDSVEPVAVAKALATELAAKYTDVSDSPTNVLSSLGDLDGDGTPELVLKWWQGTGAGGGADSEAALGTAWALFLIARDGAHWRASSLVEGSEAMDLGLIKLASGAKNDLAIVLYHGETEVPYPVVFEVRNHVALLVWDGRSDDTLYKGYDYGQLDFQDVNGDGLTEMVLTGREDPGLLVFPKDSQRGFTARTTYAWNGKAYVPAKIEYSLNPDYTLYRFISALHMHNFKAAYALIDPKRFLEADEPTADMFKQRIQDSWPEFLDDQIFEAQVVGPSAPEDYSFALPESPQHYVYRPKFSEGGKVLVGLERREGN